MAALIHMMVDQASTGTGEVELDPSMLGDLILTGTAPKNFPHLFHLSPDDGPQAYVLVDPSLLFGAATIEDLDGERTVFGLVDKAVGDNQSLSLDRYLLPGLNRTARRALGGAELGGLLESCGELMGRDLDESAISIQGPALLV